MLHVLPEIIDIHIIAQIKKEKNKKRKKKNRQRPTFPGSFPPSIIGAKELNFCVRDGNRCSLPAIVTGFSFLLKVCTFKTEYIISCILQTIGQVFDLLVSVS